MYISFQTATPVVFTGEPKRKSLTSSFMQMIKRPSGSLGLSLPSSISQPSNVSEDHLQVAGTGYR